ncbi:type II secretion system protein K-like protein [Peptoanaerobacter stomatis]|uniref:Type II secretion system protein K-like protein n=1 Tax=Peptoanaerobacter stomatis TaxID=796937 RepID=J6HNZ6_9FIRM|nr:helix-hairpin-helix domain-containing protein [Peptoanaerobacter stomatis]EJU24043.1 type II secretion system protein K-like protein [Peptoanaerobacter stomatis]NWO25233.1 helix-hairpin-helix domain-containing protein [Peptostreptococcaceae bacterium oral taxon 081]
MKRKDIIIIITISIILSLGMIIFHSTKSSDILLDKNENTKISEKIKAEDNEAVIEQDSAAVKNEKVVVYISGEVVNPQVIEMKDGDRLIDAVEKCGGMTENADKNAVNLALLLKDEDHYVIPKIGENLQLNTSSNNKSSQNNNLVNINTADKTTLISLPSIGEKTAEKIIQYRETNGNFKSIDDIKNINGIGEKKFEQIKDLITVK